MKKHILFFVLILFMLGFASCDDGRIYEETIYVPREGRVLKFTGKISGIDNWTDGYSVVLGGFDAKSEYAVVAKNIQKTAADDDEIQVVMSGISEEVTQIELCVINQIRKRVVTFQTMTDIADASDTIRMDAGTVDVGMYSAIQQQVFNKSCTACHGGSTTPAAGLYLLESNSYASLVNQASTIVEGQMRVNPGNAQESTLHLILSTNLSSGWGIDHSDMITSPAVLSLVKDWIDNGAKQ